MKRLIVLSALALSGCVDICPEETLEPAAFFNAVIPSGRELACYPRTEAPPVCVPKVEAYEGEWVEDFTMGEGI